MITGTVSYWTTGTSAYVRSSFPIRFSASGSGLRCFPPTGCSMRSFTRQGTGRNVPSAARSLRQPLTVSNTAPSEMCIRDRGSVPNPRNRKERSEYMGGRKRTVQIKFRVTEAERDLILDVYKRQLGYSPAVTRCAACGCDLRAERELHFSAAAGGALCSALSLIHISPRGASRSAKPPRRPASSMRKSSPFP